MSPDDRNESRCRRGLFTLAAVVAFFAFFAVAAVSGASYSRSEKVMGTELEVVLYGQSRKALKEAAEKVFSRVRELDEKLSSHKPSSELSKINSGAGESAVAVSQDVYECLRLAFSASRATQGAFNPLVGSQLRYWGFLPGGSSLKLKDLRGLSDIEKVRWEDSERSVFLTRKGMALDLGGIGKGFALDEAANILRRSSGVPAAAMNFGGQVFFLGKPPGRRLWPVSAGGTLLEIAEGSFATSGGLYQKGHILDPRTGLPARPGDRVGVSVLSPSAAWADALSTALFVLYGEAPEGLAVPVPYRVFTVERKGQEFVGYWRYERP